MTLEELAHKVDWLWNNCKRDSQVVVALNDSSTGARAFAGVAGIAREAGQIRIDMDETKKANNPLNKGEQTMGKNEENKPPLVFVTLQADDRAREDWAFCMTEIRRLEVEEHNPVVNDGRRICASLYCRRTAEDIARAKKELCAALSDFYKKSLAAAAMLTQDQN